MWWVKKTSRGVGEPPREVLWARGHEGYNSGKRQRRDTDLGDCQAQPPGRGDQSESGRVKDASEFSILETGGDGESYWQF